MIPDLEADLEGLPELPYAGTSGFAAGSPASEARARDDDAEAVTSKRQRATLTLARTMGAEGVTWREVASFFGWHHGQASGVLSVLHMTGRLARLGPPRRLRCSVYVTPEFVLGRETEPHGSARKAPTPFEWWGPEPDHTDGAPTLRACREHREVLHRLPFDMALAAATECPRCETFNAP